VVSERLSVRFRLRASCSTARDRLLTRAVLFCGLGEVPRA